MFLRTLKKELMSGRAVIRLSFHTRKRLKDRGYQKGDIVSAIMNGKVNGVQYDEGIKYVIEGKDMDNNPIVVIVAITEPLHYVIVSVMPPIDRRRFTNCI